MCQRLGMRWSRKDRSQVTEWDALECFRGPRLQLKNFLAVTILELPSVRYASPSFQRIKLHNLTFVKLWDTSSSSRRMLERLRVVAVAWHCGRRNGVPACQLDSAPAHRRDLAAYFPFRWVLEDVLDRDPAWRDPMLARVLSRSHREVLFYLSRRRARRSQHPYASPGPDHRSLRSNRHPFLSSDQSDRQEPRKPLRDGSGLTHRQHLDVGRRRSERHVREGGDGHRRKPASHLAPGRPETWASNLDRALPDP